MIAPASAQALSATCTGQDVAITPENAVGAERSLQCLVNVYRADHGRKPLTRDNSLEKAARRHSDDMVARGYFNHKAPSPAPYGTWHWDRAFAAGYPAAPKGSVTTGENIGSVQGEPLNTAAKLFEGWRNSPQHDKNMLDPEWATIGLGIVRGWTGGYGVAAGYDQGATVTGLFGARNRGGTDTAADLVGGAPTGNPGGHTDAGGGSGTGPGTEGCSAEQKRLSAAEKRFAKARMALSKAKAKRAKAISARERSRAARNLRAKARALKRAKSGRALAKQRYKDCRAGF